MTTDARDTNKNYYAVLTQNVARQFWPYTPHFCTFGGDGCKDSTLCVVNVYEYAIKSAAPLQSRPPTALYQVGTEGCAELALALCNCISRAESSVGRKNTIRDCVTSARIRRLRGAVGSASVS